MTMKVSRQTRLRAASLLLRFLIIGLFIAAAGSEAVCGVRPLKVGVLNNTSYAYQDKNGVWRGSDVECMIDIAQKAGLNIEFVDSNTDPDILSNLKNGKYDILTDMAKGESFRDDFLFTDQMIGIINSTLAVRPDDHRWDYGDIGQLSRMKIGLIGAYETNSDFRKWCKEHGVTPKIVEYSDIKVMSAALEKGDIDGELYLAVDGAEYSKKFHTILKILPEECYFAFRKNDVELKNKVDAALAQIMSVNADYLVNLKNKYEAQFNSNILPLSSAEKAYIKAHPVVGVAVIANDAPFYVRNPDGSGSGIIPDYYKLLANWSGLKFHYDVYATYEDAVAAVKSGKSAVLAFFSDGLVSAYSNGFSLTDGISTVSCILLAKQETDVSGIKKIAVVSRTLDSLQIGVGRLYPNASVAGFANVKACFQAVADGRADAALLGTPASTWLINQTNSNSYNILPVPGIAYDICAAVKTDNQLLCSILNKSVTTAGGNFNGLVAKNTLPQSDWKTAISRIPPAISVLIVCVLLALIAGLLWAIILLRGRQKERAAMLQAQSEVEQQRIRAEASEKNAEEKNAFFSNISHDMRTPLNAVIGFADLGVGADSVQKKNEYFTKIKSSGKLLNSLIDDTLTISKINSGKLQLHPEPTCALEMFGEIVDTVRQTAAAKNVAFTAEIPEGPGRMVLLDRLNVQKICLNLLSNAIKYTQEGGHISLRISNEPSAADGPDSLIEVSDDGIGISEEFLPQVFEPFKQERRHGYESVGTGLGLAIVKQIVELMGGEISVRSAVNKGTTFTVRLHFQETAKQAPEPTEQQESAAACLTGKKLLLCEDNDMNSEIAVALLKDKGAEVVAAENGQLGLQYFSASAPGEFAAILMDLRMPVMDGLEATKAIRSLDRADARTVPIIAMTADAFAEDVQACFDAGMNGHVAKPIDPEKMMKTLTNAIK